MYVLKNIFIAGLFFVTCFFAACNPRSNQTVDETLIMRIPVSIKDSMLLSIDKSPMDMIYFPDDYPKQKMITPNIDNPVARVIYSRPQKNGRIIFADSSVKQNVIQHYGQDWRVGANEATELEFFKAVAINGQKIQPGSYILYCIPYQNKWKIIFNSNLYSWGLHIDKSKNIIEIELPVQKNNIDIEYFTMLFQNATYGCDLVMAWGKMKVVMPVKFD